MTSTTTIVPPRAGVFTRLRRLPAVVGPLVILLALCLVLGIINPRFLSAANLANLARQGAVLLMPALGVSFIIMMGGIDLSIEGVMGLSSVVVASLVLSVKQEHGLGALGILIAMGVATVMGLLNGVLHTRLRVPSFMVTLGMMSIGIGLGTWLAGGIDVRILDPRLIAFARGDIASIPNLAFFGAAIFLVALFLERYTRFGRYIRAIGGAEDRAILVGIPVDKYKTLAFTIAGFFYGVSGVLTTLRVGAGTANISNGNLFAAITAVVVGGTALTGGTGGVVQTLIGVLIVTVIGNGMIMAGVHNFVQLAVHGVIITIAVILTMDRTKVPIIK